MISLSQYPLLESICSPADLRTVSATSLERLAEELRLFLIQTVAIHGGHFAAGLGAVELTIALHYEFNTPFDRIVWDVGHQAYPHKVLTGRRERLGTIKQKGGIAPFPSRTESMFDTFGVGHSSTSISAALGMAVALAAACEHRRVVAVIGDGAMGAGLAFEGLNHGGSLDVDLLVILNDNAMSISENVGAMSNYFAKILARKQHTHLREGSRIALRPSPAPCELAQLSEARERMIPPGVLFDEMGWNYLGPIDGNDLGALIRALRSVRDLHGPQFLHVVTRKGKGYPPAEADPIKWHCPDSFDPLSGTIHKKKIAGPTFSQVVGQWLCDMAERDARIVGVTPAMREGSGLVEFKKRFAARYFDVGIAEQHAVTFAAGLACEGAKPVVAIYSTFLQRAYDQLIHDVAIQKLPVVFALDRAGLVGGDGATHHGCYDLSYLRCIPNMVVMAPADENECRQMLYTATTLDQPTVVRFPRGQGPGLPIQERMEVLPIGRAQLRRQGRSGLALLAFGSMVTPAQPMAEYFDATLANMRFIKPLDEDFISEIAACHRAIVTLEENVIAGGAGSAISEYLAARCVQVPILHLGIPDRFIEHGSREDCLALAGLDEAGIESAIHRFLKSLPRLNACTG